MHRTSIPRLEATPNRAAAREVPDDDPDLHSLDGFRIRIEPIRDGDSALMPALLAFDTSGERIHIGVAAGEAAWVAEEAGGSQASANLIPCVRQVLDRAGIGLRELDAIAYGQGPGAFTGLRAACSTAQGLAWGAGLPVLPIDTLMAVAEDARARAGARDVWVAMDARMGEIFAGRYRWSDAGWATLVAPALVTPDALAALCASHPSGWLAGSALGEHAARLQCRPEVTLDPDAGPRAHALLACARAAWARDKPLDPADAIPRYLRDKVALTIAQRKAGARSAA